MPYICTPTRYIRMLYIQSILLKKQVLFKSRHSINTFLRPRGKKIIGDLSTCRYFVYVLIKDLARRVSVVMIPANNAQHKFTGLQNRIHTRFLSAKTDSPRHLQNKWLKSPVPPHLDRAKLSPHTEPRCAHHICRCAQQKQKPRVDQLAELGSGKKKNIKRTSRAAHAWWKRRSYGRYKGDSNGDFRSNRKRTGNRKLFLEEPASWICVCLCVFVLLFKSCRICCAAVQRCCNGLSAFFFPFIFLLQCQLFRQPRHCMERLSRA